MISRLGSFLILTILAGACTDSDLINPTAPPSRSKHVSNGSAATAIIHVDPAAPLGGDGTASDPFRRLTDALAHVRALRSAANEKHWASSKVVIEVAAGILRGSYSPARLAADPTLEALPFIINVPGVSVRGSSHLEFDSDGRPTGAVTGVPTRVVPDAPLGPADAQVVFLIAATTDGFAGNGSSVEGFVVESGHSVTRGGLGAMSYRVHDYGIRRNVFGTALNQAIDSRYSSGEISANFAVNTAIASMIVSGPGAVKVENNRALASFGGLLIMSTIGDVPFSLGVHAPQLAVETVAPTRSQIVAHVTGNDFSGHVRNAATSFGMRLMQYGIFTATTLEEPRAILVARNNRLRNNIFGMQFDAGFVERGAPPPTGFAHATFMDNDVGGNARSSMLVTFTQNATVFNCAQLATRTYMERTSYNLLFLKGDEERFADMWIDHPAVDPVDDRVLDNKLSVNGRKIASPYRFVPVAPNPC